MTDAPAALSTHGLGFRIGGADLLTDIDLAVAPGELIGVIGPNGAGKTTLFNLLTGLIRPTSGEIRLGGNDVTRLSTAARARRGLGRTFQTSSVFPALTAETNVAIAMQAGRRRPLSLVHRATTSPTVRAAAREHLAAVGLADRADIPAGSLAHGEQRKVELAVLLATDPDVVLLDEPLAGVGSGDIDELAQLIRMIARDKQRTVLLVEHHMDVVLDLSDRVAVLHYGRLLICDRPDVVMADATVQEAYLGTRRAA